VPISLPPEGSAFFVFRKGPQRRHITRITKDGKAVAQGNATLQLNASEIFVRGGGVEVIRQDAYELTWSDGKTEKLASTALPPGQTIEGTWKITFLERPSLGEPITAETDVLKSWTESSQREIKYFSGTARYTKIVDFADEVKSRRVYLDLGNVLDLVTVRLNGKVVDTCWIAPFRVDITDHLVKGRNLLELDVTNCWEFQKPGSEKLLRVSGLLGPVRLQFAEIVSLSVSK